VRLFEHPDFDQAVIRAAEHFQHHTIRALFTSLHRKQSRCIRLTVFQQTAPLFVAGPMCPPVTAEYDTVYGPVQVDLDRGQAVLYSIIR